MTRSIQFPLEIVITAAIGFLLSQLLVIGLPWIYFVGLFAVAGYVLLFFANPLACLGVLLLFRTGIDSLLVQIRFGIGGANLGLGGGLSLLLIGLTVMLFLVQKDESVPSKLNHPLIKLYALYCFYSIFTATYSEDPEEVFKIILRNFTILAIIVWTIMVVRNEQSGYFLLRMIAWSFLPSIILGFMIGNYTIDEYRGVRYCASLSHPNILADYILIMMAAFAAKVHLKQNSSHGLIQTFFGVSLLIIMLLFTKTRSGYISAAFLFLVYSWFNNRRLILPVVAMSVCLVSLPFVSSSILASFEVKGGKIELNQDDNLAWRIQKSTLLFREAMSKPIFGHGFRTSRKINTGDKSIDAHNDYAQFLLDSGLVGFCLYFGPFVYMFITSLRQRKHFERNSLLFKVSNFFTIATPAFLLMSVSDNLANYIVIQWYYWSIAGIYIAMLWNVKHDHQ